MIEIIKSAVMLSILSAPVKLGLWNTPELHPGEILKKVPSEKLLTQEIIEQKYPGDAGRASDMIIERCFKKKIKITTIWDTEYPSLLKEIHNPPLVLYSTGRIPENRMISIVGTRNSDEKSEEITRRISERAGLAGFTVVSGMAMGIDRNAHLGALKSGCSTAAVLPGGIDMIYPQKNSDIYRMISESVNSAVISEYPPGIGTAQKWTFAKRNRIISGLSDTVIVVQAPVKSGAMITARYAIDQNRELLVCPGNAFDEIYSGCNELIRQGAAIFSDMNDLFSEKENGCISEKIPLNELREIENDEKPVKENRKFSPVTVTDEFKGKVETRILEELKNDLIDIDKFIRINNFSAEEMNQGITMLEIAGYIERKGNRLYRL